MLVWMRRRYRGGGCPDIVAPVPNTPPPGSAPRRPAAAPIATAMGPTGARRAAASAGEQEWQVSIRAGIGTVDADGRSPFGGAAGIDVEYGITDAWAAHLSATAGFHPVDAQ